MSEPRRYGWWADDTRLRAHWYEGGDQAACGHVLGDDAKGPGWVPRDRGHIEEWTQTPDKGRCVSCWHICRQATIKAQGG